MEGPVSANWSPGGNSLQTRKINREFWKIRALSKLAALARPASFSGVRARGYTGSLSRSSSGCWRNGEIRSARWNGLRCPRPGPSPSIRRRAERSRRWSPRIKPRGLLTRAQVARVERLNGEWPAFAAMRRLAMRFRGIVPNKDVGKLETWLKDAQHSGLYAMQRFAHTLRRDIDAMRNAITKPWSHGQTEGQR